MDRREYPWSDGALMRSDLALIRIPWRTTATSFWSLSTFWSILSAREDQVRRSGEDWETSSRFQVCNLRRIRHRDHTLASPSQWPILMDFRGELRSLGRWHRVISGIRHHRNGGLESEDLVFQFGRLGLPGRALVALRSHLSALHVRNGDQKYVTLILQRYVLNYLVFHTNRNAPHWILERLKFSATLRIEYPTSQIQRILYDIFKGCGLHW
jgi:hypothetical protein